MPEFSDPPPNPGLLRRSFGNLFAVPMALLPFVKNRIIHAGPSGALVAIIVLIAVQTGLSLYYGYELEWLYETIISALGSTIGGRSDASTKLVSRETAVPFPDEAAVWSVSVFMWCSYAA